MNITFRYFNQNRAIFHDCELCNNISIGWLDFQGFESIQVCEDHKNTITEDNPLLVPYLRLLDVCC